ncbi:Putative carboxypeptidase [Ignavibacterium album JCM 16511]|uniref:Putative carboxypeptidase n=1 Tax=Ignavibacterium album (strain DSM 19864 / JCM 16511 / NBRC 101810 / Mat9-16) TaxID=945713 RepID=I0AGZ0_IGNAJ|nr:M14 family metallopeptidase [Ignavibacterium album]AFH48247.1 Putative carboxypeptidase [Ignavibacterium album JCM 16511]
MNYWLTHFEKSGMTESPDYNSTIKYFEKFEKNFPYVKIKDIGLTPQGRKLKVVIVSKDKAFTPQQAKKTKKAVVLIQNGIHPGEIEGKDACMLLLREILVTKEKSNLLNNLILLIIPVLNIDGHERISPFNRPNQNGPKKMGWRTNALNLNLNRDYLKVDTPEIQSFLKLFNEWLPDFMIDNHTTNGADYQYHVTYGIETHQNIDRGLVQWIKNKYLPYLHKKVEADGFIIGPYMEFKDGTVESGILDLPSPPRLSHGYCAAQNRVCLLVETHSLKPFANRVFSTKSMMQHTLEFLNENFKEIMIINNQADKNHIKNYLVEKKKFPLVLVSNGKFEKFLFKGFEWYDEYSEITGSTVRKYTDKPIEIEIPIFNQAKSAKKIFVPEAYLIPQEFENIIRVLKHHHINLTRIQSDKIFKVERYRFNNVNFAPRPYEGRQLPSFDTVCFEEKVLCRKGTYVVPTNQRALRVIVNLLEPDAPDSFVHWGFFNAFFERKEYAEAYIMEPYAKVMIENDQSLKNEFYKRLEADEKFRNNPLDRLDFFYRKSLFFDKGENVYPIMRLIGK